MCRASANRNQSKRKCISASVVGMAGEAYKLPASRLIGYQTLR